MNPLSVLTDHPQSHWRQSRVWLLILSAALLPLFIFGWALTLGSQSAKAAPAGEVNSQVSSPVDTTGYSLIRNYEFGTTRNVNSLAALDVNFNPYAIAGTIVINNEWQRYQPFRDRNHHFTTNTLELTAQIEGGIYDGGISSGQIATEETFYPASGQTLMFQLRAFIPRGAGTWPAFWLYAKSPPNTASEIDIFEFFNTSTQNTYDWTGYDHGDGVGSNYYNIMTNQWVWHPGWDFADDWHVYTLIWKQGDIQKWVDGTQVKGTYFDWIFGSNPQVIINLAIGGTGGTPSAGNTPFPSKFILDYFRVWSKGPGTAPPPTNTPTRTNTPVPGSCGSTNVALNKPATASSVEATGVEAAKAVDGNTTTRWSSLYSDPQWIYVDLGSTQSICRVRLNWETAYGKSYQIQTSNDASNWTPIYSTSTGDGGIDDLTGLSGSGRYVRMHGTVRGTIYGYSLWEFDIYTGSSPTATPTRTNTPIPPTNTPTPTPGGAYDDEFNVSTLAAKWSWIRQDAANWSLTAAPGFMRIVCQAGDINGATATGKNILLETAPTGDWSVVTKLTGKPTANWAQAGLIVYQNDDNWVKMVRLYDNANVFQFAKEIAGTFTFQNTADSIASTTSYLKITKSGTSYSGYYSADGVSYTQAWTTQTASLSTIKIGLISFAGTGLNADFDYLRVTTSAPTPTPTPTRTNTPTAGNTHGGTWAAKANLNSPQTWKNFWQTDSGIATNTSYVASIWLKGAGSIEIHIHNGAWTTTLSSTRCNATSTWTQCTSAAFNTGSNTTLVFAIGDPYNDDPVGVVYLDDAFLGVSGGANKVVNAGFESGNTTWINDDATIYSILQNP